MSQIIRVLDSSFYAGPAGIPRSEGNSALTHQGWLRDASGKLKRAWFKLLTAADRQFVNEITGYLLARHCQLPCPQEAFIVHVPVDTLSRLHPHVTFDSTRETLPLWASLDLEGRSARYHFHTPTDLLTKELLGWDFLIDAVAFDEWIANMDRNMENLIYLGKKRWALIDHGNIIGSPAWATPDASMRTRNVLKMLAWPGAIAPKDEDALIASTEGHAFPFSQAIAEMRHWWGKLLPESDAKAMELFLMERLTIVPDQLKQDFFRVC